ncbi:MMPL family transporter [Kitasatospora azatica]|uniref:MMPL family transporter n=1 Tax=Kitasatospora azatica TaxID=58347 RepID=UPI000B08C246|nr:MMPL family transporter [Kitasatospora azatica]
MFSSLGSALHSRRRVVLLLALLVAAVAAVFGGSVADKLTNGLSDYDNPGGDNVVARNIITGATGIDSQQGYVLLVRTDQQLLPGSTPPAAVTAAGTLLRGRPEVKLVLDYSSGANPALISRDGLSTLVVGAVRPMSDAETKAAEQQLQQDIAADPELRGRTWLGGATPGHVQVASVSTTDLGKGEGLATPIILIALFLVFRGVVAASVPVVGSIVSLLLTMAGLRIATTFMHVSSGAMNLAFALCLGLSIDFGLLIVTRYREELAEHGPGAEALRRTVTTAGRTVLFSALTVAAALAALMVFPQPYLRSMGLAGVITVVSAALFALVGLPALLAVLGSRINALAPRRWQRGTGSRKAGATRWHRLATGVMRRPAVFAGVATVVLLLMAFPLTGVRFTGVDPTILPTSTSAGQVAASLATDFEHAATTPVQTVLDSSDGTGLAEYARRVAAVPGVASVGTPFRLDASHWEVDAVLSGKPLDQAALRAGQAVEGVATPNTARYTGVTADYLAQRHTIADRLPEALAVLAAVTLLLLFVFSGSVVLPLTALLMNLLTTGATFGFLVWLFQDGNLGNAAHSGLETTTPVLVFALAFGLSTDYNVFLLGRIKESRAAGLGEREAVAEGLADIGATVTSAAALFFVAVGALALGRLIFIKELGLGAAFAVLLDATVVRALLVPSLMAMLGAAAWWAPRPLRWLHSWLRLDRVEGLPPTRGADFAVGEAREPVPQSVV